MAKDFEGSDQLREELEETLKDPRFARELEEATRELRERFAEERKREAEQDPAKRYEESPDLGEVEGWDEELDAWARELQDEARSTTDPELKELLYRRAWLIRGATEFAWYYLDLD